MDIRAVIHSQFMRKREGKEEEGDEIEILSGTLLLLPIALVTRRRQLETRMRFSASKSREGSLDQSLLSHAGDCPRDCIPCHAVIQMIIQRIMRKINMRGTVTRCCASCQRREIWTECMTRTSSLQSDGALDADLELVSLRASAAAVVAVTR